MGEPKQALHVKLRLARKQAGLSQGQVAAMLGLHRPSVTLMESGRRRVSSGELTQLSELYDVSISWLTQDEEEEVDPAVELAARELVKLKKEDLDTVLRLLQSLRKSGDDE